MKRRLRDGTIAKGEYQDYVDDMEVRKIAPLESRLTGIARKIVMRDWKPAAVGIQLELFQTNGIV